MKNESRTTIMYEKELRGRSSANDGKTRIDAKKSDAVCEVGLEKNRSLQAAAARSND